MKISKKERKRQKRIEQRTNQIRLYHTRPNPK